MVGLRLRAVGPDRRSAPVGWAMGLLVFLSVLTGCSSVLYHDLIMNEYRQSDWVIQFQMDEINWLVSASGDSASVAKITRDTADIKYYRSFAPDSGCSYYILTVRADKLTSSGAAPNVFNRVVGFDSLILIIGSQEKTLTIDGMRQRHFVYSGSAYCGLEPIPIPGNVKSATLRASVRIANDRDSKDLDRVTLTLPIKLKRLTNTLLNPWP